MDGAEGRTTVKRKALRSLVAIGTVKREGTGKKNSPYLYSRSPVPGIYREQEKQDIKPQENTDTVNTDSCSRDFSTVVVPEKKMATSSADDYDNW